MDQDISGEPPCRSPLLINSTGELLDLYNSEPEEDGTPDHLYGSDTMSPSTSPVPDYPVEPVVSWTDSTATDSTGTDSIGSDSSWNDSAETGSECSDDSFFVLTGRYECSSGADLDYLLSGRWIDSGLLAFQPFDICRELEASAKFALHIADPSRDILKNGRGRFFAENEYLRLDERLISDVFVILFCFRVASLSESAEETPTSQFFAQRWTQVVRDLMEHLKGKTFSRETFEAEFDLEWIENESSDSEDSEDF